MDQRHHAGPGDPGVEGVDPDLAQALGDEVRRLEEVEVELGDGVQVPPPPADLGLELGDAIDDGHGIPSGRAE